MYNEMTMPKGVEALVNALCADYFRRSQVISERTAPYNVIMEYRFLNYRIMNAALEIVGARDALAIISDIGKRRGYAKSDSLLSEKTYKSQKTAVKHNIARRLSLL